MSFLTTLSLFLSLPCHCNVCGVLDLAGNISIGVINHSISNRLVINIDISNESIHISITYIIIANNVCFNTIVIFSYKRWKYIMNFNVIVFNILIKVTFYSVVDVEWICVYTGMSSGTWKDLVSHNYSTYNFFPSIFIVFWFSYTVFPLKIT